MRTLLILVCTILLVQAVNAYRRRKRPTPPPIPKNAQEHIRKAGARVTRLSMEVNKGLMADKSKKGKNACYSALSIYSALVFAYVSSKDKNYRAKDDFAKVLGMKNPPGHIKKYTQLIGKVVKSAGVNKETEFKSGDRLWLEATCNYKKSFNKNIRRRFGRMAKSLATKIDFKNDPGKAVDKINKWSADYTNNVIKEILDKSSVNSQTIFILTNAIYFKGAWENPFPEWNTRKADFFVDENKKIEADMMQRRMTVPYVEKTTFEAIELFYKGREFSMLIFLPKEGYELDDIFGQERFDNEKGKKVGGLTASFISKGLRAKMTDEIREVSLPKFKMAVTYKTGDLERVAHPLKGVSMKGAVTKTCANQATISDIVTKTVIAVDEKGTEAAAVTAVIMGRSMVPQFTCNRPFAFAINHVSTKTALFFGKVYEPKFEGAA